MNVGFVLGGPTAWRTRTKGDICAAFHWFGKEDEPTVFFWPRYANLLATKVVPFGLPLGVAHELVLDGKAGKVDTHALLAKATRAASLWGMEADYGVVHRVMDLMLECLDDLCDMPPKPRSLVEQQCGTPAGELTFTAAGKTLFEGEVG